MLMFPHNGQCFCTSSKFGGRLGYWIRLHHGQISSTQNNSASVSQLAWKKCWPSCVAELDFEGPDEKTANEIMSIDKSKGL